MKDRKAFETTYGALLPATFPADAQDPGYPGEPPFTRGIQPTMYRGRPWTMRQYAGFGSAAETNERFRYLLGQGQTGLSVAFDLPTQMGFDADDPRALGEVGKVGVAISTLSDIERLFEGIPLSDVTVSMTINSTAPILLAMVIAAARRQGVDPARVGGTTQNDILKEYIARGTYVFPPAPSLRLAVDLIEYCASSLPRWNPISISGYHIREAGSDAVQELAFAFADAIAYVEASLARGLAVDDFAAQLSFFFAAHSSLLEEVAKFRAARRVWERITRERFGAKAATSRALRFHTQTMGSSLTAQQPYNNIVRTAIEALAAVLGGTQSLHTNAYDEALTLPSEASARIALRTQQIIAEESGVTGTIDPFAGAYAVEALTADIERLVLEEIARIDEQGGAVAAIAHGYQQERIEDSAYKQQRAVESGERIVVGVNAYRDEQEVAEPPTLTVDERVGEEQRARLVQHRAVRDGVKVGAARTTLRAAASGNTNLMPHLIEAVEAGVTLGEICTELRGVFGTYATPARR